MAAPPGTPAPSCPSWALPHVEPTGRRRQAPSPRAEHFPARPPDPGSCPRSSTEQNAGRPAHVGGRSRSPTLPATRRSEHGTVPPRTPPPDLWALPSPSGPSFGVTSSQTRGSAPTRAPFLHHCIQHSEARLTAHVPLTSGTTPTPPNPASACSRAGRRGRTREPRRRCSQASNHAACHVSLGLFCV